jgi:heme-degrading monooxygenase HmoA
MNNYYCIQILGLKPGASGTDLEALLRTRVVEMGRWIPGVQRFSLMRTKTPASEVVHYLMTLTFESQQAYRYWRQVEEEAHAYWPQLASILQRCEQISTLLAEYEGTMLVQEELNSDA